VLSGRNLPTFQRCLLPPSSGRSSNTSGSRSYHFINAEWVCSNSFLHIFVYYWNLHFFLIYQSSYPN
jgi:hypothetical protein